MELINLLLMPDNIVALLTLIALEVVLGIDNLIFISLVTGRLPEHQQKLARFIGIGLAVVFRIGLLFSISYILAMKDTVMSINDIDLSWRDIILIVGGVFLLYKATTEIHHKMEGHTQDAGAKKVYPKFWLVIVQILFLDLVFSVDSILTAIGMVAHIEIMVIAVIVSVLIMVAMANPLSNFVNRHPTLIVLALGILMMIGVTLIAEGLHFHIPKGYIYFAMGFAFTLEMLNIAIRGRKKQATQVENAG